jgi:uncharacterized protein YecT (DUF1311 family)
MKSLALLPLVLFSAQAHASDDSLKACIDAAESTPAMEECANTEVRARDALLNQVFQQVKARASRQENMTPYNPQAAVAKLVQAERAWIAYRDATCAFTEEFTNGHSDMPLQISLCDIRVTQSRIDELRKSIEE